MAGTPTARPKVKPRQRKADEGKGQRGLLSAIPAKLGLVPIGKERQILVQRAAALRRQAVALMRRKKAAAGKKQ